MENLRKHLMRQRVGKLARNRPQLADALERNINTILELRNRAEKSRTLQEKVADAITGFSGSMPFLYLHVLWFGVWIVFNQGWVRIPWLAPFDPFPFGLLTLVVSLEAIFLSTLVMISQNRAADMDAKRADLDLQIDLLGEYEITRILQVVTAIGQKLEVEGCDDEELRQLEERVSPEAVLNEIEVRRRAVAERP